MSNLIRAGLRNPAVVSVRDHSRLEADQRTPASLENFYLMCDPRLKLSTLVTLLRERAGQKLMVFAATCACVDYFNVLLKHFLSDTNIFSIHGKMKKKRHKIFNQFREAKSGILLCTDVMARGVDIPEVDWYVTIYFMFLCLFGIVCLHLQPIEVNFFAMTFDKEGRNTSWERSSLRA